jgi:excisionase family DNA binding protein
VDLTVLRRGRERNHLDAPGGLAEFIADRRATYTVAETAMLLGISKSMAYECVQSGQLPALRLGRRLLVTRVTLLRLLGVDPLVTHSYAGDPD